MILDYDELTRDPLVTINRVCGFLGIAPMRALGNSGVHNAAPRVKSEVERAFRRRAPGFLRQLPPGLKAAVRDGFAWFGAKKRRLRPDERRRIAAALHDDMIRLQREYGVDVARWGFFAAQPR